jgi:hypothetical protein
MTARPNPSDDDTSQEGTDDRVNRRTEVRYRLAQLLTLEKFDEALNEALVARGKEDIFPCDLQFVVEIVKAAERMGRVKINHTQYPLESITDAFRQQESAPPQQLSSSSDLRRY